MSSSIKSFVVFLCFIKWMSTQDKGENSWDEIGSCIDIIVNFSMTILKNIRVSGIRYCMYSTESSRLRFVVFWIRICCNHLFDYMQNFKYTVRHEQVWIYPGRNTPSLPCPDARCWQFFMHFLSKNRYVEVPNHIISSVGDLYRPDGTCLMYQYLISSPLSSGNW